MIDAFDVSKRTSYCIHRPAELGIGAPLAAYHADQVAPASPTDVPAVRVRSWTLVPAGVEALHDSACHVESAPASKADETSEPLVLKATGVVIATLSTRIVPGVYVSKVMPLPERGLGSV